MTLSTEDALALLIKWQKEGASIAAMIVSPIGEFKFGCSIDEFTVDYVVLVPRPTKTGAFYVRLTIAKAFEFDYSDSREIPEDAAAQVKESVIAMLRIGVPGLPHATSIALCEVARPSQN
jgi:hypothetical protein